MKQVLWVVTLFSALSLNGQKLQFPETAATDWGSFSGDSMQRNSGSFLDAQVKSRTVPTAWVASQLPFGFSDLRFIDAGLVAPFKQDSWGLRFKHFGTVFLQTQQFRLMLSKSLGKISISGAISLDRLKEVEKKSSQSLGADIGFLWGESNAFHWGFQIERLIYSNRSFQQPIIKMGAGFRLSDQVYSELRVVSDETIKAYMELCYQPYLQWQIRIGYRYPEIGYWYGLAWNIGHLIIEHQMMYQPLLGYSPGIRIFFTLKSKKA